MKCSRKKNILIVSYTYLHYYINIEHLEKWERMKIRQMKNLRREKWFVCPAEKNVDLFNLKQSSSKYENHDKLPKLTLFINSITASKSKFRGCINIVFIQYSLTQICFPSHLVGFTFHLVNFNRLLTCIILIDISPATTWTLTDFLLASLCHLTCNSNVIIDADVLHFTAEIKHATVHLLHIDTLSYCNKDWK